jgi:DNA-binding NtrC family response regulator
MQAKLLLAIERREIRPVGGTESRPVNVHIVAATNRNLTDAVNAGEFRRDLYHRLRVIEIRLASLRERREDIPRLVRHFLALHCQRFGLSPRTLSEDALEVCSRYDWPGNVRELSHLLESALLQAAGTRIEASDLHLDMPTASDDGHFRIDLPGDRCVTMDFSAGSPTLEEVEQSILRSAFDFWGQNLSRAARSLGITREALRYRLNKGPQPVHRD